MAKSFTFTAHGLGQIFTLAEKKLRDFDMSKGSGGKNIKLLKFLKKYYTELDTDGKKCAHLITAGFDDSEKLEKWFAKAKADAWKVNPKSNTVFMGSLYQYDQKWHDKMGRQNPIKKIYQAFGVKGQALGSTKARVSSKEGSVLYFWYPKSKDGLELYEEAMKIAESKDEGKAEVIIPFVDLKQEGSYKLEGSSYGDLWEVTESTFKNLLQLTETGAKARSEVRVTFKATGKPMPVQKPKRIVFNKPFAVAIFEKGMQFPAFVAKCEYDSWLKV